MLCPRVLAPAIASSEQTPKPAVAATRQPIAKNRERQASAAALSRMCDSRPGAEQANGMKIWNELFRFDAREVRLVRANHSSENRHRAERVRADRKEKNCVWRFHSLIFLRQMKTRRVRRAMRHTIFVAVALDDPPTGTVAALQIGRSGDVYCKGSVSSSSVSARGAGSLEAATIFSGRL